MVLRDRKYAQSARAPCMQKREERLRRDRSEEQQYFVERRSTSSLSYVT